MSASPAQETHPDLSPQGRRSEMIRSPSTGWTKRVCKGQRWLAILQRDQADKGILLAFRDKAEAERQSDEAYDRGYMVHYVEAAEVVV